LEPATLHDAAAPAIASAPIRCALCGGDAPSLRYPARGGAADGARAYACTSFGHRAHGPIWECDRCDVLFQWPLPDEAALVAAYQAVEDPLYLAEKDNRYLTFRRAVRLLGPARGRRLLDVGAYCGIFADVARAAGFDAEALELSRWAAAHARALGLVVHERTLTAHAATGTRYDVVTLWDVIEHLPDPRCELEAAYRLLAPGGRLYLSTIDTSSLVARTLGPRWPWLMHMHLFYFDRSNLAALLEQIGFRVLATRNYVHTVSAGYLLRKLAASFPAAGTALAIAARLAPARLAVPVSLGDNMAIEAERPA
jgi:2-polyprenyl-3-methyl-5-hydroxy-6-metoxy-1,4-benzoquinol methylase